MTPNADSVRHYPVLATGVPIPRCTQCGEMYNKGDHYPVRYRNSPFCGFNKAQRLAAQGRINDLRKERHVHQRQIDLIDSEISELEKDLSPNGRSGAAQ